jgi:hypothetical protein
MEGGDWGPCLELPMADEDGEDSESGLFSSSSSELNWQAGCEDGMAMNGDVMASQYLLHRPSKSMRPSQVAVRRLTLVEGSRQIGPFYNFT